MTCAVLAFAAGVVLLQQQAALPALAWAALLLPLFLLAFKHRFFLLALSVGAGFFWAALCARLRMSDWLSRELEGRDHEIVGVVSSLPAPGERGVRFEFEVESASGGQRAAGAARRCGAPGRALAVSGSPAPAARQS